MKVFVRYFAYILIISAFFRLVPIAAALIYNESYLGFVISAVLSLLWGGVLLFVDKQSKTEDKPLNLADALMLVALSFVVLPVIGAISFLPSFNFNILNAVFESISGFTTTGLTLYSSLDVLPRSLLMWRAETQWMGGLGIIMVFLFIFSRLKFHAPKTLEEIEAGTETAAALYQAGGFPQKLEAGLKKTTRNVTLIYGSYTLLGVLLLYLSGMSLFNSIGLTFTSLSTGGFVLSDGFYTNGFQLFILGLLMVLGATSFITHNKLLQKKFKEFFLSFERNLMLIMILIAAILSTLFMPDIKVVLFELVSAFTTTGYSISTIPSLPQIVITLLVIGMLVGGSIASTAGGIKVFRIYTLMAMVPWVLKKLSSPPHAVIPFKFRSKVVEEEDLMIIGSFVFFYFFLLVTGTIIFLLLGHSFFDSSFQIVSALGTVGLQTIPLASVHWLGKLVLIFAMILGRLEIFPILVLLRRIIGIK